jgi:integrase
VALLLPPGKSHGESHGWEYDGSVRGSKRKLKDGVWELRVDAGTDPITGKRKQTSVTFRGPSRAADQALRDLVDEQAPSRSDGVGANFGQLLDQWLEECERMDLSPTTIRNYRSQVERTIRPTLGKVTLSRLTAKNLDALYGAMKDAGKSPKTIRNHHAIIATALHQGVRWGWVRTNVAEMAKPPRVSQSRVTAPSLEIVRDVIEGAERRDPRLAPLLMLAALTGMRRGELCALRWSDVDLNVGTIDVTKSLVVAPGGLVEKSTKTNRGRLVALDPVGVAVLTRHRSRAEHWIAEAGSELPADAFVFSPFPEGTTPFRPDNVTSFFIRVRNEVGAPTVRLHDLRHFTATQLIGAGVDVRTVAGRLGHSDPSVTLRVYSHALEERDRAAASIMGGLLATPIEQSGKRASSIKPV